MSLLNPKKKRKQPDPLESVQLVDVSDLMPPDSGPEPKVHVRTPIKTPSRSRLFAKRKTRTPKQTREVNPPHIEKQNPSELMDISFSDRDHHMHLIDQLKIIPRTSFFKNLPIGTGDEKWSELMERVLTVCTSHEGGEYEQRAILQSGLEGVKEVGRSLLLMECTFQILMGDDQDASLEQDLAEASYENALSTAEGLGHAELVSFINISQGNSFMRKGQYEKARDCYQRSTANIIHWPEAWFNLGIVHSVIGDHEQAIGSFNQAIGLDENDSHAHFNLGINHYSIHEYEKALDHWKRSFALDPENLEIAYYLGKLQFDLKDYEKAVSRLEAVVATDPSHIDAWNILGLAYTELGDADHAVASYRKAIRGDLQDVIPMEPGFQDTSLNSDKPLEPSDDPTKCWDEALDFQPLSEGGGGMDRDNAFEEDHAYGRAVECFENVVDEDEKDDIGWYNLASAQALKQDSIAAIESLKRAIEINNSHRNSAQRNPDFSTISSHPEFKKIISSMDEIQ